MTYVCHDSGCDFAGTQLRLARHIYDEHTDQNATYFDRREELRRIMLSRHGVVQRNDPPLTAAMHWRPGDPVL